MKCALCGAPTNEHARLCPACYIVWLASGEARRVAQLNPREDAARRDVALVDFVTRIRKERAH